MSKTIPIIDTHIHLWDLEKIYYGWLTDQYRDDPVLGNYRSICRNYTLDDFQAETAANNVCGAVHIEATVGGDHPPKETRWVQQQSDGAKYPLGIVGYAAVDRPDLADVLDEHSESTGFRGVRMLFASPDQWTSTSFLRGMSTIQARGLTFDLDADPSVYRAARELVGSFPNLQFIYEHAGFPKERSDEYFSEWRKCVRGLAELGNLAAKIGGLGMCDHTWTVDSIRPWVEATIEAFGSDRVMFGSNWPVDSLYSSYEKLVDAYKTILASAGSNEMLAFFHSNAARYYDLDTGS